VPFFHYNKQGTCQIVFIKETTLVKSYLANNMKLYLSIFTCFFILTWFYQCQSTQSTAVQVDVNQPFEKLSDYNFFINNITDLQPNERVLPYDLNSPLFSDYAEKARFIFIPESTKGGSYSLAKVLDFQEGTVLIKNFYYNNDERDDSKGKRIIETRLLMKNTDGWQAHGYTWNDEQTDAFLNIVGDIKTVNWTNQVGEAMKVNYIIPNKNQCKSCHYNNGVLEPIGPKVRNLNKNYTYAEGEQNQLKKWAAMGYLEDYDENIEYPKVAEWDNPETGTLHERALAYLDVNCAHCHNPNGPANTTGLTLTADAEMNMALGIWKSAVAAGTGTGGHQYNIVPGHPETSIMAFRMASTEPAEMMPELGRRMIHKEGLTLIEDWIRNMPDNR
jgi:uncharacterized repeat protein (TIGR03806 family)